MIYQELTYEHAQDLMHRYGLSALCAKVIASKHLDDEKIKQLLDKPVLSDPLSAMGVKEVRDRLLEAKAKQEKVLVCGDYDADGICATAIMYDALCKAGITCGYYIPNRFKEGYGLNVNTVKLAKEKGYQLLITVDNGIKAYEAAQCAKDLGLELIISDHHAIDGEVPPCSMLLHSSMMGDNFTSMSGAGIALEVSRALIGDDINAVVLAGVAAIGDVMELWNENRRIVRLAISYLNQGYALPIQKLGGANTNGWDETAIAFQVVPKLNVTGRLSDIANANITVRYLLSSNAEEINKCSKQINELNELRKIKSEEMSRKAYEMVDDSYPFQVIYDENFHEGLVGLVAGKLCNDLHKPVMVLTRKEDEIRGSIRSYGDLDLRTFFDPCRDLFTAYGGHQKAAGVGLNLDHLNDIRTFINDTMKHQEIHDDEIIGYINFELSDDALKQIQSLDVLKPFGEGFRSPIFKLDYQEDLVLKSLSQGKHLKWSSDILDILYFNQGEKMKAVKGRHDLEFFGSLSINTFRNRSKVSMTVEDLR